MVLVIVPVVVLVVVVVVSSSGVPLPLEPSLVTSGPAGTVRVFWMVLWIVVVMVSSPWVRVTTWSVV
jgi:hypothetical protein